MPRSAPVHRPLRIRAKQHCPAGQERGNSTQRGYGYRWQKTREGWLKAHPLCLHCQRRGLIVVANEVDHIVPHRGDQKLFWDPSNWQSLCKPCHSRKTGQGK